MPKQKRSFSDEFRLNAVKLVIGGQSAANVAKACDIRQGLLYKWIDSAFKQKLVTGKNPIRSPRKYEHDLKRRLVQQIFDGVPVSRLAEENEIDERTLYHWKDEFLAKRARLKSA